MLYKQHYNGIPLDDSFVRICMDADGVYRIANSWKHIEGEYAAPEFEQVSLLNVHDALAKAGKPEQTIVEEPSFTYVNCGNNVYTLCHRVILSDGYVYLLDVKTGALR